LEATRDEEAHDDGDDATGSEESHGDANADADYEPDHDGGDTSEEHEVASEGDGDEPADNAASAAAAKAAKKAAKAAKVRLLVRWWLHELSLVLTPRNRASSVMPCVLMQAEQERLLRERDAQFARAHSEADMGPVFHAVCAAVLDQDTLAPHTPSLLAEPGWPVHIAARDSTDPRHFLTARNTAPEVEGQLMDAYKVLVDRHDAMCELVMAGVALHFEVWRRCSVVVVLADEAKLRPLRSVLDDAGFPTANMVELHLDRANVFVVLLDRGDEGIIPVEVVFGQGMPDAVADALAERAHLLNTRHRRHPVSRSDKKSVTGAGKRGEMLVFGFRLPTNKDHYVGR
jgi:hypothetical protein